MSSSDRHELSRERIMQYEQLVVRESAASQPESNVIQIAPAVPLGDKVIEVSALCKGFENQPLIKDLSFKLPKGGIVGIVGPNGTGKTTLFRMLTGVEKPDSGTIDIGPTVKMVWIDQHRDSLNGENTVFDEISEGQADIAFGKLKIPARAYCGRFGFRGSDQQKFVKDLSGGERNRVHLAKILKSGGNVILLDEPTNDLDVNTLRLLEDAISDFSGCILVISHDRFFLNRICTHLMVFEGESHVEWFEGNYEEYEAMRLRKLGSAALENRRARYRRFKPN